MRLNDSMDGNQAGASAGANSSSDFVRWSPILLPHSSLLINLDHRYASYTSRSPSLHFPSSDMAADHSLKDAGGPVIFIRREMG